MRVLVFAALLILPSLALAQDPGMSPGQGGMTFAQARAQMPGLSRVTFDKFDPDGDGVIPANKVMALQSTYNVMYLDRG
jgi:hypothetical protein